MNAKYKMTGCARFMIFLVILLPIAYFGSKYLRESGTWDKIKDKVESSETNSVERAIEQRRVDIDLPETVSTNDAELADKFGRLREAYEEQELILANQAKEIKDLRAQNDELRSQGSRSPNAAPVPASLPPSRTTDNRTSRTNEPTMDDLLREADGNLGTSSESNSSNTGAKKELGAWSFSFSGSQGKIELYQQGDELFSRTTYQGSTTLDIDKLSYSGDRFTVVNSPEGEYYVLNRDGDLEAYARSGFQVTCRRL